MFTKPRPVPSSAALVVLRQLAYISSGTAVGGAALCAEERRRRTKVLQRVADNAKRLRESPRYAHTAAVARADDAGEWERMFGQRGEDATQDENQHAVRGPELPSIVEGDYQGSQASKDAPAGGAQGQYQEWDVLAAAKDDEESFAQMHRISPRGLDPVTGPRVGWYPKSIWGLSSQDRTGRGRSTKRREARQLRSGKMSSPIDRRNTRRDSMSVHALGQLFRDMEIDAASELEIECARISSQGRHERAYELLSSFMQDVLSPTKRHLGRLKDYMLDRALANGDLTSFVRMLLTDLNVRDPEAFRTQVNRVIWACVERNNYGLLVEAIFQQTSWKKFQKMVAAATIENAEALLKAGSLENPPNSARVDLICDRLKSRDNDITPLLRSIELTYGVTRNFALVAPRLSRLAQEIQVTGSRQAHKQLQQLTFEIHLDAGKMDLAIAILEDLRGSNDINEQEIMNSASIVARKREWASLDGLLRIAKEARDPEVPYDYLARRSFSDVVRSFSEHHDHVETWSFVANALDDLAIHPTDAMIMSVLHCFVEHESYYLIPKWLQSMSARGVHFRFNKFNAAQLLKRYYRTHRPPHALIMWLCRKLAAIGRSIRSRDVYRLVVESIGYDLRRSPQGKQWNVEVMKARYERVERAGPTSRFVPSPGYHHDSRVFFEHPNAKPLALQPPQTAFKEPHALPDLLQEHQEQGESGEQSSAAGQNFGTLWSEGFGAERANNEICQEPTPRLSYSAAQAHSGVSPQPDGYTPQPYDAQAPAQHLRAAVPSGGSAPGGAPLSPLIGHLSETRPMQTDATDTELYHAHDEATSQPESSHAELSQTGPGIHVLQPSLETAAPQSEHHDVGCKEAVLEPFLETAKAQPEFIITETNQAGVEPLRSSTTPDQPTMSEPGLEQRPTGFFLNDSGALEEPDVGDFGFLSNLSKEPHFVPHFVGYEHSDSVTASSQPDPRGRDAQSRDVRLTLPDATSVTRTERQAFPPVDETESSEDLHLPEDDLGFGDLRERYDEHEIADSEITPGAANSGLPDHAVSRMLIEMSLGNYEQVLTLYLESCSSAGLPASPTALEIVIEASIRFHKGDTSHARDVLADAQNAGMNVACAVGPLIIQDIRNQGRRTRFASSMLRRSVIDYYRMNDENGLPVKHTVGTTAADVLIRNSCSLFGLQLLRAIHRSQWAVEQPFSIVAMTVFLKAFISLRHVKGIHWVVRTVIGHDLRIDIRFLRILRLARTWNPRQLRHFSLVFEREPPDSPDRIQAQQELLESLIAECETREEQQFKDVKTRGYRLVYAINKAAREHRERRMMNHTLHDDVSMSFWRSLKGRTGGISRAQPWSVQRSFRYYHPNDKYKPIFRVVTAPHLSWKPRFSKHLPLPSELIPEKDSELKDQEVERGARSPEELRLSKHDLDDDVKPKHPDVQMDVRSSRASYKAHDGPPLHSARLPQAATFDFQRKDPQVKHKDNEAKHQHVSVKRQDSHVKSLGDEVKQKNLRFTRKTFSVKRIDSGVKRDVAGVQMVARTHHTIKRLMLGGTRSTYRKRRLEKTRSPSKRLQLEAKAHCTQSAQPQHQDGVALLLKPEKPGQTVQPQYLPQRDIHEDGETKPVPQADRTELPLPGPVTSKARKDTEVKLVSQAKRTSVPLPRRVASKARKDAESQAIPCTSPHARRARAKRAVQSAQRVAYIKSEANSTAALSQRSHESRDERMETPLFPPFATYTEADVDSLGHGSGYSRRTRDEQEAQEVTPRRVFKKLQVTYKRTEANPIAHTSWHSQRHSQREHDQSVMRLAPQDTHTKRLSSGGERLSPRSPSSLARPVSRSPPDRVLERKRKDASREEQGVGIQVRGVPDSKVGASFRRSFSSSQAGTGWGLVRISETCWTLKSEGSSRPRQSDELDICGV